MLRVFIVIVLFIAGKFAFAQSIVDKSADHGLMVRQIPGTESALKKFFSQSQFDSDTVYATIFRPANCPRCDGFLNSVEEYIKTIIDKPYLLVAVYPDSLVAKDYIKRYNLKADEYLFDINEDFADFLSFSPGYLHVGYILKINKSTGELIVGSNADNVSPEFVRDLANYSEKKEAVNFPSGTKRYFDWDMEVDSVLKIKTKHHIELPDSVYTISEVIYQPVFYDNHLLWNDKLALAVAEFEMKDTMLSIKRVIEPGASEFSKFVSIDNDNYQKLLRSGMLKNIPLQAFVINDDKFGIAYSLPEVWYDNGINYRNKPCYIVRSFKDVNYRDIEPLEYDFTDEFYYPHFNMKSAGNDNVVVGVERITWPMIPDKEEYMNIQGGNPFVDEFYDRYDQPTLALYKKSDGKLYKRFGKLPSFSKKAKTGYSFSGSVFDCWDRLAVYGTAFSGRINVVPLDAIGCDDCTKEYLAFDLDDSFFQVPDSTDYYSYNCNALAEPMLNREIRDVKVAGNYIFCIMRNVTDAFERPEREKYNLIVINRVTGKRKVLDFPEVDVGENRRIAYGLRRLSNGDVEPFYVTNTNDGWYVVILAV